MLLIRCYFLLLLNTVIRRGYLNNPKFAGSKERQEYMLLSQRTILAKNFRRMVLKIEEIIITMMMNVSIIYIA